MLSFPLMRMGERSWGAYPFRTKAHLARGGRGRIIAAHAAAVASATVAAVYSFYMESRWYETTTLRIPVRGLPPAFHGFRIVQLSDIHLSSVVPMSFVDRCLEGACDLDPDLIVLTGDYVTTRDSKYSDQILRAFRGLRARAGTIAVLGNHDRGIYKWRRSSRVPVDAAACQDRFDGAGVRLLVNESILLRSAGSTLAIVGLDDLWSGSFRPDWAFDGLEAATPRVVLCHNPNGAVAMNGHRADIILSGHTHGGQVVLPLVGARWLPTEHRQFVAGLYRVGSNLLYVNRGIGHLPPARFNCHPEISVFELAPAH
ncbi:MAG: phosphodiesterase YaeI [Acidobacteria bacterium]|nr:phosphodiesterase YaeI [Acidobacteriota bacterium]